MGYTKDDFEQKAKKNKSAATAANSNVVKIPITSVQQFYTDVFTKTGKTVIDYMIAVQSAIGCRLIEV